MNTKNIFYYFIHQNTVMTSCVLSWSISGTVIYTLYSVSVCQIQKILCFKQVAGVSNGDLHLNMDPWCVLPRNFGVSMQVWRNILWLTPDSLRSWTHNVCQLCVNFTVKFTHTYCISLSFLPVSICKHEA